jgi:pseudouridine 5'-phosphatase
MKRQVALQQNLFKHCKPLPGVESLLQNLSQARTLQSHGGRRGSPGGSGSKKVRIALATSSHQRNFEIKTANLQPLFSVFPPSHIIVGDDTRIPKGRGKPLPDIYLLALNVINQTLSAENEGERPITPEECLIFEDSVPGAEAGRRAGMRVVWVPHPGLLEVYQARVEEVLAGATGEHKESDLIHKDGGTPLAGSPGSPGSIGDGWAEKLSSLSEFNFDRYGIVVDDGSGEGTRFTSESGQPCQRGTTDKELEEMTARADGKVHAKEEPTPHI